MIEFLGLWIEKIIIAVILTTIIEMILPSGTIKKYIKVIMGIYITFVVISPIIKNKFNKYDLDETLETFSKYENVIDGSTNNVLHEFERKNADTIKDICMDNIEKDIKNKLKEKNYTVNRLSIDLDEKDGNYALEKIELSIKSSLNQEDIEIDDLTDFLSKEYLIDKKKIIIK